MSRWARSGVLLALLGATAACGSSDPAPREPPSDLPPRPTPAPTAAPTPSPQPFGVWLPSGPAGGIVYDLEIAPDGSALYAATNAGIFRRDAGGSAWTRASDGLRHETGPQASVADLAVSPHDPRIVYAATAAGVHQSLDGGASWRAVSAALRSTQGSVRPMEAVAVDPHRPGTIYAAGSAVFRSEDRGETWTQIETSDAISIAAHPNRAGTVLVGTQSGLVRSHDAGETWTRENDTIPERGAFEDFYFDPDDPEEIFAAASHGVVRSRDGGATWHLFGQGLPAGGAPFRVPVTGIEADGADPSRIYVATPTGIYSLVRGGGAPWAPAGLEELEVLSLAAAPSGGLYAGTYDLGARFQESPDHAWRPFNVGLEAARVFDLAIDPVRPGRVYAGTARTGVALSEDFGRTWRVVEDPSIRDATITALAIDPADPEVVYAVEPYRRLFRSQDAGATWELRNENERQPSDRIGEKTQLIVDPSASGRLFLADGSLSLTEDDGRTWTRVGIPSTDAPACWNTTAVALDVTNPQRVYAVDALAGPSGSTDGGHSFEPRDCPLTIRFSKAAAVAIDPAMPDILYAGSSGLLSRSSDAGTTWTSLFPEISRPGVRVLAADPFLTDHVYAAMVGGLQLLTDAGTTRRPVGLEMRGGIRALAIDPASGRRLIAATSAGPVERIDLGPVAR